MKKQSHIKPRVGYYAFWKYDLFPYTKGALITGVYDSGNVETTYGKGFVFSPFIILRPKQGKELLKELHELEAHYNEGIKKNYLSSMNKLRIIFPTHPMCKLFADEKSKV
jgi:hypothetical protein